MPKPGDWTLCLLLLAIAAPAAFAAPATTQAAGGAKPFELKDGDRVVFVGGTFMEREGQLGYIETMLTSRFPDRNVTFRNLGYAGDTVGVEARRICQGWADFGGPDEGFNRLRKLIEEIKPTVVVGAYGMAESFAGEAGLPEFVRKYNRLLDMLTTAGGVPPGQVRVVLLSPTYHQNLGPPLPDPSEHNLNLQRYGDAIRDVAETRGCRYVDLLTTTAPHLTPGFPGEQKLVRLDITSNGIHLNPLGYGLIASHMEESLGYPDRPHPLAEIDRDGKAKQAEGVIVKQIEAKPNGLSFTVATYLLPKVPKARGEPISLFEGPPDFIVRGLPPEKPPNKDQIFVLKAGGDQIARGTADDFETRGVEVNSGPAVEQAEHLRHLIVAKNADFFHYWRPENDTYILGYRKGEQGRNAVELPQFKPLVEAKEKEIAKLRVPQPVTYTLEKK